VLCREVLPGEFILCWCSWDLFCFLCGRDIAGFLPLFLFLFVRFLFWWVSVPRGTVLGYWCYKLRCVQASGQKTGDETIWFLAVF